MIKKTIGPVSYTHLDVYKRQESMSDEELAEWVELSENDIFIN